MNIQLFLKQGECSVPLQRSLKYAFGLELGDTEAISSRVAKRQITPETRFLLRFQHYILMLLRSFIFVVMYSPAA